MGIKLAQKGYFRSKTGTKFPQKEYFRTKIEKWHFCERPWSLLTILNFSARTPTDTTPF